LTAYGEEHGPRKSQSFEMKKEPVGVGGKSNQQP